MKLKKFFAGVLAAAMMLTVGATAALAETPAASTITVPGSGINGAKMFTESDADLALTKTLVVNNGTAPDSMTFNFSVKSNGTEVLTPNVFFNRENNTDGQLFTAGTYTRTFNVNLATLLGNNKTKVGEYTYTISENDTQIPGITKDPNELTLKVTVVNATGEIGGGYGYYAALYRGSKKIEATDAFHNTYSAKRLTLTKTVHGSLGDLNEDFQFDIKFVPEKDEIASLYKGVQVGDLDKASIDKAPAGAYLNLNTVYTVTMKHNGSLSFANLPAGIKYEVYEVGSAVSGDKVMKNQYTVTVTDTAFAENSNTVKGAVAAKDVTVAFQNTHEGVPDTGVILDNAPYIALLAIVAIGGVALMLNKRRRDEE
ncbi:MAG: QVPTGV class sortase B protein-sorting domain-containing protein [Agathobaculum butyriciproducens]